MGPGTAVRVQPKRALPGYRALIDRDEYQPPAGFLLPPITGLGIAPRMPAVGKVGIIQDIGVLRQHGTDQ